MGIDCVCVCVREREREVSNCSWIASLSPAFAVTQRLHGKFVHLCFSPGSQELEEREDDDGNDGGD